MPGDTYYLGDDGLWHRRGSASVRPGELPPIIDNVDPAALQIVDLKLVITATDPTPPPPPPPPPPPGSSYYGECPEGGGSTLSAASTVVTKLGKGASIRQFMGSAAFTTGPFHPSGASVVHTSWSPRDSAVNSGSEDANITALAKRAQAGDIVEYGHESDNDKNPDKTPLTAAQIADRIKAKNRFYDLVKKANPDVLVAVTMTGGFWADYGSDTTRDRWVGVKGDLLGVDFDALPDQQPYKSSCSDEVANVKKYVTKWKSYGFTGWTAPEFAMSRQTWDTDGKARADWMKAQAKIAADGGAYAIMWFGYDTAPHNLANYYNHLAVGSPELKVWTDLVATNPKS